MLDSWWFTLLWGFGLGVLLIFLSVIWGRHLFRMGKGYPITCPRCQLTRNGSALYGWFTCCRCGGPFYVCGARTLARAPISHLLVFILSAGFFICSFAIYPSAQQAFPLAMFVFQALTMWPRKRI